MIYHPPLVGQLSCLHSSLGWTLIHILYLSCTHTWTLLDLVSLLPVYKSFYFINWSALWGFPPLRKSVFPHVKNYNFSCVLEIYLVPWMNATTFSSCNVKQVKSTQYHTCSLCSLVRYSHACVLFSTSLWAESDQHVSKIILQHGGPFQSELCLIPVGTI